MSDEKLIELAKEIKKLASNKSKYTDWTNRLDIKDELYTDELRNLMYTDSHQSQLMMHMPK